jgi:molybdate transport system substrate-binding protein
MLILVSACRQPTERMVSDPPGETQTGSASSSLIVFAAASLTGAFTEIAGMFEAAHPGARVELSFAGSQQLSQQLAQGAPADVFASADQAQMDAAVEAGRVSESISQPFTSNRLVVIYPGENPGGLHSLSDLSKPELKLILAAPEVPVGRYSRQFLEKASRNPSYGARYLERVESNIVSYEENVRSVLSKVQLGEADAGIVYSSDLVGERTPEVGRIEIPDDLNIIAVYYLAPISDSKIAGLAAEFVEFVLSPAGQEVLAGYGFKPGR